MQLSMRDPTKVELIAKIDGPPKQVKDPDEWNFDITGSFLGETEEEKVEQMAAFGLVRRTLKGTLSVCLVEGSNKGKLYLREADNQLAKIMRLPNDFSDKVKHIGFEES